MPKVVGFARDDRNLTLLEGDNLYGSLELMWSLSAIEKCSVSEISWRKSWRFSIA